MADAHTPPQNIEAEASVLGAMLVSEPVLPAVQAEVGLQPDDFYLDRHRLLFAAILKLAGDGKPVDELTVVDRLGEDLEKTGGRHYVSELAAKVPSAANGIHYAKIVRDNAQWRGRLTAGQEIQAAAIARDAEAFTRAHSLLADERAHNRALYDVERQNDLLFELMEGRSKAEFFWSFAKLNRLHKGGMRRGQLVVVSGYTNEGKSHFAAQLLDQNRKHGSVCLYDNEMDPEEQAARRANRIAGIPYGPLVNGELDAQQRSKLVRYMNDEGLHWPIVDTTGWSVEEVALDIRQQRHDFVVVDILHNFPFEDERQIAAAVARLKQAAKLADCVVVLTAHVNRSGASGLSGMRRRPMRSDLKWSGDIENLADVVCFVYRNQDPETFEPIDTGAIYFDKCRGGELGGVAVRFNKDRLRFELDRFHESPADESPPPSVEAMGATW
ncbi:MAG TPA: DnaB-like helicase C-terminal domain-containing protein [Solirubrobacterales bacterium]|nr:DnaB-like helicase C-terminal domain-containing protein [Solirubrobacterales bacterium]